VWGPEHQWYWTSPETEKVRTRVRINCFNIVWGGTKIKQKGGKEGSMASRREEEREKKKRRKEGYKEKKGGRKRFVEKKKRRRT